MKLNQKRRGVGFTLIELVIAVAVVGLLAAIAIPSYQSSIQRGARTDAKGVLMELSQFMERNFTTNNCYHRTDGNCAAAWAAGQNGSVALPIVRSPSEGVVHYNIRFRHNPHATRYTIEAVPNGNQANDECGTLIIDHRGQRKARRKGRLVNGCW